MVSALLLLFLSVSAALGAPERAAKAPAEPPFLQINAFYGLASINPADVNRYLTATVNPTLTMKVNEIKNATPMAAEILISTKPRLNIGVRYSIVTATSGVGETSGGAKRELRATMNDVSLILKYQWDEQGAAFYLGGGAGTATIFKIEDEIGGVNGAYTASSVPVIRALTGLRVKFGFLAIIFEAGYQLAKANLLTEPFGSKWTSDGRDMGFDFSGPMGLAGLGFQF